jgi:hypothetical protein
VTATTPPGWPPSVRPPQAPDWQRSAVGWLLDRCPPEYRDHPVIARHPLVLVRLTAHHVQAGLQAGRRALATVRADLGDDLPVPAMNAVIEALEAEQARLIAARRAVGLIEDALRGRHYVPRL